MKKTIVVSSVLALALTGCGASDNEGPTTPADPEVVTETITVAGEAETETVTETVTETATVTAESETEPATETEVAQPAPSDGVWEGDGLQVFIEDCYYDSAWDGIVADVVVTNTTSDTAESVYGTVEVLNESGRRIDELLFSAERLAPGQEVAVDARSFNEDIPESFTCEVLSAEISDW